ncbi:MAG: response regulator [Kiritimatiellae bacterium]|nr:response regulator [Kiritimatiellia bacterium]
MASIEELEERIRALEFDLQQARTAAEQIAQIVNNLNNLLAVMRGHAQIAAAAGSSEALQDLIRIVLSGTTRAEQEIRGALGQAKLSGMAAKALEQMSARRTARLLVVDDEELIRTLLYELLTKSGHEVVAVATQKDALEVCRRGAFDVVFMDVRLREGDGVEALRQIRRIAPDIHCVFISGDPDVERMWRLVREEQADGFISKPFDIREIDNAVALILNLPAPSGLA